MQSELQLSFQRVEQALQRLTDSIAAYNPDVRAAEELTAADEAVGQHLQKLVTHQRNHLRIQELRRQTDAYDAEIKSRIGNIADTRKALANIPAYNPTGAHTREVNVDELLRYAKYISRSTVPPTLPKVEPKPASTVAVKREDSTKPAHLTNGTSSPPAETADQTVTLRDEPSETKYMTEGQRVWIAQRLPFEAWPEHYTIQAGALGAMQRMVEAGRDPAGVLSKEEQAEVEKKRAEEEERERVEMEERERRWNAGGRGRGRERVEEEVFNPDDI